MTEHLSMAPPACESGCVGYSDQFMRVTSEKLLTYALGRRLDPEDMPVVRKIAKSTAQSNNRFSALVLGIVESDVFQKNMLPSKRAFQMLRRRPTSHVYNEATPAPSYLPERRGRHSGPASA